ncbi:MAG: tetratricopeptide repeat protein [Acidobacteria bacterium]|nr:tetratricopeptide repeat protein [Acidobacteriota bacterium]MBS1866070.1 tetratricopeptide repeat protein [Acidobacteriota bacterium]
MRYLQTILNAAACASLLTVPLLAQVSSTSQSAELTAISALVQHEKLPEAERRLTAYLQTHPRSPKAHYLFGTVLLRQGNFPQAEMSLQRAIALEPSLLDAHLALGDAFLAEGKTELALAAYQDATKISPLDPRANLSIAKVYLGSGEFQKSIDAAEKIPAERRTAELLPTLAAAYFGLQQPEKAAVEIQSMLQIAGKQPDLIPELAEFFMAHRDFKSSQQLLTVAGEKQPATDRFLIDSALTQAGLGQLDDAQATLEGVLARKPGSVEALIAAGKVAAQQTNWDASAEAFSRADSLAPGRPDVLYGLVTAQLRTNQPQSALANAQKLRKLAPDDLRITYLLTLASFGAKEFDDAKKFAVQVLAVHPEDREMNLVLADIALNDEHNLPAAREHAKAVLSLNSDDPSGLYYLGMIQKLDGDLKGAIQLLTKSVAGNPKSADAQAALGALCLQAGDLLHAVPALEQAIQLAPDESQNYYQLALAYTRVGAPDKAKVQLEKYRQMKEKEEKDAKDSKGPSTSEVPSMGIGSRP